MTESNAPLAFKRQKDVFVLFHRETNSKSGKIYLLANVKYTWSAYLSPPFTGINHYTICKKKILHNTLTLFIHDFISNSMITLCFTTF